MGLLLPQNLYHAPAPRPRRYLTYPKRRLTKFQMPKHWLFSYVTGWLCWEKVGTSIIYPNIIQPGGIMDSKKLKAELKLTRQFLGMVTHFLHSTLNPKFTKYFFKKCCFRLKTDVRMWSI